MYDDRTEKGQRAIGCSGLDDPFDEWPYRNNESPIYASFAMNCSRQEYLGLGDIVEKFAGDQQYFSVTFMEAWDLMTTNGNTGLTEGPTSGWFGFYSLQKQGRHLDEELQSLPEDGIVWTDPNVTRSL